MFAVMPSTPPSFAFGRSRGHAHRPAVSSPLSSSPIRMAPSPPLSPCNPNTLNTLPRQTQSSPISASTPIYSSCGSSSASASTSPCTSTSVSSSSSSSKFRFATRNPRPNPRVKRREEAQDTRRRLFLQNVRQRAEDKRWELRGGEDELLKLEWWRLNRERQQAKEAEAAQYMVSDAELAAEEEEELRRQALEQPGADVDMDALMADVIAQQEEAEMEALVSTLGVDCAGGRGYRREDGRLPGSPQFSDDEDYDGLFEDLISQQDGQPMADSQDVEMT